MFFEQDADDLVKRTDEEETINEVSKNIEENLKINNINKMPDTIRLNKVLRELIFLLIELLIFCSQGLEVEKDSPQKFLLKYITFVMNLKLMLIKKLRQMKLFRRLIKKKKNQGKLDNLQKEKDTKIIKASKF